MKNINENSANLVFSINLKLDLDQQLQLISILIQKLYVLEGFPSKTSLTFIENCIDNNVDVAALPTNIFVKSGSLPNILIDNGIRPLLLYEK
ncbi:hypothetical protein RZE82_08350 [Mollicutes bacterium LVI A0039]|nr:hypothetical protein RZE82_08350 [Mollicutes bacterium LVI A0039]